MTTTQAIQNTEQNMRQAQARGMIRTPKFAGKTYTQVRAERHRQMQVYKVWALGTAVLVGMAVAIGMVML